MIIPELHFFQIKRKPFLGDTMELDDALLGVTPEALNAVDVDLSIAKMLAMVDIDMPVTAEHQRIITFELVRVNDAATPDHLDRQVEQSFSFDILNSLHMDTTVSLEDTEYRNLIGCPTTAFAFAPTSKVGLVQFNSPVHPVRRFNAMPNRLPDGLDGFQSRGITQTNLLSNPASGDFQFKELDDPQPLLRADFDIVDPAVTEVMEGVLTPLATVSFAQQPVDFIAITSAAKNMPFFPAEFTQIQPGTVFTFDDELKGF